MPKKLGLFYESSVKPESGRKYHEEQEFLVKSFKEIYSGELFEATTPQVLKSSVQNLLRQNKEAVKNIDMAYSLKQPRETCIKSGIRPTLEKNFRRNLANAIWSVGSDIHEKHRNHNSINGSFLACNDDSCEKVKSLSLDISPSCDDFTPYRE